MAACEAQADELLTPAAVREADARAAALLEESVGTYRRVLENGEPRVDALVCCGNALRWAPPARPVATRRRVGYSTTFCCRCRCS